MDASGDVLVALGMAARGAVLGIGALALGAALCWLVPRWVRWHQPLAVWVPAPGGHRFVVHDPAVPGSAERFAEAITTPGAVAGTHIDGRLPTVYDPNDPDAAGRFLWLALTPGATDPRVPPP